MLWGGKGRTGGTPPGIAGMMGMGSRLQPMRFAGVLQYSSILPERGGGRLPPYAGGGGADVTPDGRAVDRRCYYEGVCVCFGCWILDVVCSTLVSSSECWASNPFLVTLVVVPVSTVDVAMGGGEGVGGMI